MEKAKTTAKGKAAEVLLVLGLKRSTKKSRSKGLLLDSFWLDYFLQLVYGWVAIMTMTTKALAQGGLMIQTAIILMVATCFLSLVCCYVEVLMSPKMGLKKNKSRSKTLL